MAAVVVTLIIIGKILWGIIKYLIKEYIKAVIKQTFLVYMKLKRLKDVHWIVRRRVRKTVAFLERVLGKRKNIEITYQDFLVDQCSLINHHLKNVDYVTNLPKDIKDEDFIKKCPELRESSAYLSANVKDCIPTIENDAYKAINRSLEVISNRCGETYLNEMQNIDKQTMIKTQECITSFLENDKSCYTSYKFLTANFSKNNDMNEKMILSTHENVSDFDKEMIQRINYQCCYSQQYLSCYGQPIEKKCGAISDSFVGKYVQNATTVVNDYCGSNTKNICTLNKESQATWITYSTVILILLLIVIIFLR